MKTIIAILFTIFLSTAGLCVGFCSGLAIGRWWGEWELNYLMDIPAGGVVLSPRTQSYWFKGDAQTLHFKRIPDPRQAVVTRLFPQEQKEEESNEKAPNSDRSATRK